MLILGKLLFSFGTFLGWKKQLTTLFMLSKLVVTDRPSNPQKTFVFPGLKGDIIENWQTNRGFIGIIECVPAHRIMQ